MSLPSACDLLLQTSGGLFTCVQVGEYDRIRTPYLYPDGDRIDLFCKRVGEMMTLTDLGETTRWLRAQTLAPRRTPKQQALIEDVCQTHGVEFCKGMLLGRCHPGEDFLSSVTRVAQAALRVSDIWFTFRTRAVESVTDEVADYLAERQFPFERGERHIGRSGRSWTVDFHIRTPVRSSLVNVLATGSRSAARGIAEHVLAVWYDLSHLTMGPEAIRFISLFDDSIDVWSAEDYRLLEPLSTIVPWSQPDRFVEEIGQAA